MELVDCGSTLFLLSFFLPSLDSPPAWLSPLFFHLLYTSQLRLDTLFLVSSPCASFSATRQNKQVSRLPVFNFTIDCGLLHRCRTPDFIDISLSLVGQVIQHITPSSTQDQVPQNPDRRVPLLAAPPAIPVILHRGRHTKSFK